MDNITHSLIGITVGRLATLRNSKLQSAAVWTAVLGNNFPDVDILLKPFVVSGNLGYLLHHRGYTHTVLSTIFLGTFSALLGAKIAKLDTPIPWKLYFLGWISILLHIAFDSMNNYGVHPFSPFSNHWYYGDFLFILEPFLWLCTLPLVYFTARSRTGRLIPISLGLVLLGAVWFGPFTSTAIRLALSIWTIIFIGAQKKWNTPLIATCGMIFVLVGFKWGSITAERNIRQFTQSSNLLNSHRHASEEMKEIALTPAPSNPFCWAVILLSVENQLDYVARKGVISLLPTVFSPTSCYFQSHVPGVVPLTASTFPSDDSIFWTGEFRSPLAEYNDLQVKSCRFRAFLRFSRIPVWTQTAERWIATDLRYDQRGREFSLIDLNPVLECPTYPPPWIPPTDHL